MARPTRPRHRSRALAAALSLAAVVAIGAVAASGAEGASGIGRFTPLPDGAIKNFTPAAMPLGMSNAMTTVIVQMAGDPVTVADANAKDAGKGSLSKSQKDAIRAHLEAEQAPVAQHVQSVGGAVIASFQAAYNGLAVQVPANQVPSLETMTGVTSVYRSLVHTISNVHGVPLIQGPQTWGGTPGFTGKGMKIADLDTGIDYTHADFGGPGTVAAWNTAFMQSTADPTSPSVCITPQLTPCFGPSAPKVKGGTDLVGDAYDASSKDPTKQIPHPDPNPLDCNSHGTHTAGTMAGLGVLSNGKTYTGPYNANTVSGNSWNVGPGVAPEASIYAVRVFGCNGSVSDAVLIQAIEWAVDNNMDAINMSLGAPFGSAQAPDSVAASNAAKDGVIVVSASGNNGSAPYITSSPGAAEDTLAVAASDPTQSFPGATLNLSTGASLTAIDANAAALPAGALGLKVIPPTAHDAALGSSDTGPTGISLGCSAADDEAAGNVTGKLIVVERGVCARVAKAIFAQQAGAAGVIMVNNSTAFPPFEGKITGDPDPPGPPLNGGFPFDVTIPLLGVQGRSKPSTSAAAAALFAANGGTVTLAPTTLANPGFLALAGFSSAGPRSGDSGLKPQVTAPGVSIASAGMGTGNGPLVDSGTSMATPHTAGTALLVKQAHPDWRRVAYWNAAIANTASPALVANYNTLGAGSGLVQAFNATHTQVVALGDKDATSLDYGLYSDTKDFQGSKAIKLHNFGSAPASFTVADALDQGRPHSVAVSPSVVTVPAGGDVDVTVSLSVPIATAGDASAFRSVAGLITFTPASGSNSGVTLNVPYTLVPQASSNLQLTGVNGAAFNAKNGQTTLSATPTLRNTGVSNSIADWFAWGLKDRTDHQLNSDDLVSAGVQSFPNEGFLVFAISTAHRWSNPAENEFDVLVDVNNDGKPDYDVVAADLGALTTGTANGQDAVAVFDLSTGSGTIDFLAGADFNGSTMELPVLFDQLAGISADTPISYTVESFSQTDGTSDAFTGSATYNLFRPVFANSSEDVVAPNTTATDPTTVDLAQLAATPQLGLLVFDQNDTAHSNHDEATTIPFK